MHRKYIFVVGGVMSGVGKGVASSSIGKILQSGGFEVTAVKIDPYVNVDAGTMNPTEHGEVFVLDDGTECDQDLGNYERFLDRDLSGANYMTTGSIYQSVINQERNLEYEGKCVEVVPHIPLEVLRRIDKAASKNKADVVITEIGGTVGEYQNILFLEAVRMLTLKKPGDVLLVLVSFLPSLDGESELKTKPTQYAVRSLNSAGLQPDIVIARAHTALDKKRKQKIAFNCSVKESDVISAPDVKNIYEVPLNFKKENLGRIVSEKLGLKMKGHDMLAWKRLVSNAKAASEAAKVSAHHPLKIGIVGKYFDTGNFILADSYISVIEALKQAGYALKASPMLDWLSAEDFMPPNKKNLVKLKEYAGIVVPGGFGGRAVEGKIAAIRYCRENKIPFFGLCYGMQLAVVEFARNAVKLKRAHTTEVDPKTPYPVIDVMPGQKDNLLQKNFGGTMRLGAYPAILKKDTIASFAYRTNKVSERHRHRYEVNPKYIKKLEQKGLIFSGASPNKTLMEIMELSRSRHPFFVGTQFHPEFKSRPLNPHPLFLEFLRAAVKSNDSRAM